MTEHRTRRTNRENESRQRQWQPASLLPTPNPIDGIAFRWVRESTMGEHDPMNMSRKMQEGWEPCKLEDHPEIKGMVPLDQNNSGMIRTNGLVLCKRPEEIGKQRAEYYSRMSRSQMDSVNNNFMRESDDRMPLFNDSKRSKVTFGSGN